MALTVSGPVPGQGVVLLRSLYFLVNCNSEAELLKIYRERDPNTLDYLLAKLDKTIEK